MRRMLFGVALVSIVWLSAPTILAFCGFYVAKVDTKLFNRASQVVLVRDGDRTVMTMANDFEGEPKEFAVVIPVPTFLKREQIHVGEKALVDHLDAYSAPRLVEYFDQNPCERLEARMALAAPASRAVAEDARHLAKALGVTIEAQYTVGEYDILILSAQQSSGLETWLRQNGYRIPPGASDVIASYLKQNMRFFVARVNLAEQSRLGFSYLRPLQVAYESPKFMLPIRLGKHVYAGSDPVTNPTNNAPIGTGPWKFKEWVRGSHFEYVKNQNYWRKDLPYLDRLIIRYVRDPAGRAAAMEAGEIQIGVFNPVAPPDIKRLTGTGKFIATPKGYEESVWSVSFECNMRNPVFAKREVRQAMFHAIDRNLIAKTVFYGYARPGTSPIFSPNKAFYTPDTYKTEFDPKTAAALLDGAGFPKKGDGKRFTFNLLAAGWFPENGKIGSYVKQALEDVGVGINLTVPDRPSSIKRIYTDYDFDLAISNQSNPSEPVPATTQYYTSDGIKKGVPFRNASGFHTDEVDALVEKIKIETDPAKRKELVVEFQKIVTREAPNLPLVELESITVASVKVQNHSNDPDYLADSWANIWLAS